MDVPGEIKAGRIVAVRLTPGALAVGRDPDELEALATAPGAIVTRDPATGVHTLGTAGSLGRLMKAHAAVRVPSALALRKATHAANGQGEK